MAKDPVCGMEVNERTAKYKTEHLRTSYYFCCAMCKELFEINPTKFMEM